jgi:hypothetical protein
MISTTHQHLFHLKLKKKGIYYFYYIFIVVLRNYFYESDIYSLGKILELLLDGWCESGLNEGVMSKERHLKWKGIQNKMIQQVYHCFFFFFIFLFFWEFFNLEI